MHNRAQEQQLLNTVLPRIIASPKVVYKSYWEWMQLFPLRNFEKIMNLQYLQVFTWIERVNSLHHSLHMFKVYGRELNDQTGNIGLSHILVLLSPHINNVTSLIRTNSLIGTDFFKIWTPLFGLARVYCTREPSNSIPIPKIRI